MFSSGPPWYYVNSAQLFEINQEAIRLGMTRCFSDELFEDFIDWNGLHLIFDFYPIERGCVRYKVLLKLRDKDEPTITFIDSQTDFVKARRKRFIEQEEYDKMFEKLCG